MKLNIILFLCLFFTLGCSAQTKNSGTNPTAITKFLELNELLTHTGADFRLTNDCTIAAFARDIKREGNHKEGLEAITKLMRIRNEARLLLMNLEETKNRIKRDVMGGINPETGLLVNPAEEAKLEILMIGIGKEGLGYKLEKALKGFTQAVAEIAEINYRDLPSLAEGNQNNPLYKADRIKVNMNFAEANFGQTPAAAALAIITHKQNEVLRTESIVMQKIIDDMRNSHTKK